MYPAAHVWKREYEQKFKWKVYRLGHRPTTTWGRGSHGTVMQPWLNNIKNNNNKRIHSATVHMCHGDNVTKASNFSTRMPHCTKFITEKPHCAQKSQISKSVKVSLSNCDYHKKTTPEEFQLSCVPQCILRSPVCHNEHCLIFKGSHLPAILFDKLVLKNYSFLAVELENETIRFTH